MKSKGEGESCGGREGEREEGGQAESLLLLLLLGSVPREIVGT